VVVIVVVIVISVMVMVVVVVVVVVVVMFVVMIVAVVVMVIVVVVAVDVVGVVVVVVLVVVVVVVVVVGVGVGLGVKVKVGGVRVISRLLVTGGFVFYVGVRFRIGLPPPSTSYLAFACLPEECYCMAGLIVTYKNLAPPHVIPPPPSLITHPHRYGMAVLMEVLNLISGDPLTALIPAVCALADKAMAVNSRSIQLQVRMCACACACVCACACAFICVCVGGRVCVCVWGGCI
jgi:hypothetical protein